MSIPDAAIEAAAEATTECYNDGEFDRLNVARAAITAAMPAIREALAQEIEASKTTQRVATDHEPRWATGACKCGTPIGDDIDMHWHTVNQSIDQAARIVRGGTP